MKTRNSSKNFVSILTLILILASFIPTFISSDVPVARAADGDLVVSVISAYNLVVDSNVSSPSTYAPRVATVVGRFCNTSGSALTNVYGYIGDGTTPGTYPARNSLTDAEFQSGQKWNYLYNTGLYRYRHVGPVSDATRYIGTIPAGQCSYQYWTLEYPACENVGGAWDEPPCAGDPLWGNSVKPEDDFTLNFVVWGTSDQDNDSATRAMTMRNEISAMANKIEPNGNPPGRWFNTVSDTVRVGDVITTNGILYSLGNVRFGFDNDGNYAPDYNAWLQPLSQADFDPTCFRLIRTSGVLTVTRGGGNPDLIIPFRDTDGPHPIYGGPLYFTNLPPDNTNVRGEVFYTFLALRGPCNANLSPYQEVASGFDNEKFNGDYGKGIPPVNSLSPAVTISKASAPSTIAVGGTTTYTIPFANTGTSPAGLSLSTSGINMPLMISDTVPNGMQYVGGSATYYLSGSGSVTIRYSTNSGASWSTTDPGTVTSTWPNNKVIIQWWLNQPLPAGSTGNYARYRATVPGGYSGNPFIENTACIGLGDAVPFACDNDIVIVRGTGSIGDFVWRDENNDGQQTGETTYGINGVAVSLYWDRNGNGQLDASDLLLYTQDTYTYSGNPGYYQFTQLPAANYLVVVDKTDAQIPTGYRLTTPGFYAVALASGQSYQTADFGFGPSLSMEKRMISSGATGCDAYEGREVVYAISLTNRRPGTGETVPGGCRYSAWATTGSTANPPKDFTNYAAAYGEPDGVYASGDFSIGSNRWIKGTGFNASGSGTITQVQAVFRVYVSPALSNDYAVGRLFQGATELGNVTFSTAQVNQFVGIQNAGYLTWTIPGTSAPGGSWTWDDFALLTLHLEPEKQGGADPSTLYIDAIGFRVTTSGACPLLDANDIMATVPLTDTYNTTYLQFVSADPPQTSVDTVNGLITWSNVGPIYPAETRVVTVRFLAKAIAGTSSQTVNNSAGSTGARFADGGYANNVYKTASGTICQTGSINGYVYSDPNSSGWNYNPGGGDLPIPGVQVTIYGCYNKETGALIYPGHNSACTSSQNNGEWRAVSTQLTNNSGYYEFTGLITGTYYVAVNSANLPGTVSQTAEANDNQSVTGSLPNTTAQGHTCPTCNSTWGDPVNGKLNSGDFNPINSPGETINGVNFGYNIQPGVYGSVWEDNNGNGSKNSGEGPIGSVTVQLRTGSCSGTVVQSMATTADGRYQFGNLTAGTTYYITVVTSTLPGGASAWTQTGESDGSINNCISFTAVAGTLSGSHDFGFRKTGSYTLGDTLYYDWNGDGTQQPTSEEGIPNVTVHLYEDANGNGIIDPEDAFIASTSTNGSGYYQFANLPAGSYLVIVDTNDPDFPAGVVETQDPDESGVCLICNSRGRRTITNASFDNVDFGYQPRGKGAIGDTVYRDMNGDGVQAGPTETGIANITVWLEVDLNNDGTYVRVATAVTDSSGKYLFSNLPDAKYRVVVDYNDTDLPKDPYNHPYAPSTPTTTGQITISGGNTYLDADFGFKPLGAIGDRVWRDDNGNGNQDLSEPGINGVTVGLYTWTDVDGDGVYNASVDTISSTPLATQVTSGDGNYVFSGLAAGNYVVKVVSGIPSGYTQSGDPDWLEPCTGSGLCDSASGVELRTGQIDMSRDFGYIPPGVIGDTLWIDTDNDGSRDTGESGIPYITVRLYAWTDDGDGIVENGELGALLGTTETDSDGYYAFGGLSTNNASYAVVVDTSDPDFPAGLSNTYDPDGVLDSRAGTTLTAANPKDLTRDFGYRYTGLYSISGTVFFDDDNNGGIYTPAYGDLPYEGITVYLYNSAGLLIATATTDSNGDYLFSNLPNGNYTVSLNPNSPKLIGMTMTYEPDGGGGDNFCGTTPPFCNNYATPVTINNANVVDQDFGFWANWDFDDLPASYGTKLAVEGPRHIIGSLYLGAGVTAEGDGKPATEANLDTDNGVTLGARQTWTPGSTVDLNVTVTGSTGYLIAWFDWNGDGDFSEANEMVVYGNVSNGPNALTVNVPAGANPGSYVYARFRLYDGKPLSANPKGLAVNGEVEGYRWPVTPTAVALSSFGASYRDNRITVRWETASELDLVGFNIYRSTSERGPYVRLNSTLIAAQRPGSPLGALYSWVDGQIRLGRVYYYKLEQVSADGTTTLHGPVRVQTSSRALPAPRPTPTPPPVVPPQPIPGPTGTAAPSRTPSR